MANEYFMYFNIWLLQCVNRCIYSNFPKGTKKLIVVVVVAVKEREIRLQSCVS